MPRITKEDYERLLEVREDLWKLTKLRFTYKTRVARQQVSRLSEPLIHEKTILEDTEGLLNGRTNHD